MTEYTAHYNILHTDGQMREKISDLDDSHPGILGAKLIHLRLSKFVRTNETSGYSHTKRSHSTQIIRQNTGHEDGFVSGDTINVYIPLMENIFQQKYGLSF